MHDRGEGERVGLLAPHGPRSVHGGAALPGAQGAGYTGENQIEQKINESLVLVDNET